LPIDWDALDEAKYRAEAEAVADLLEGLSCAGPKASGPHALLRFAVE